MSILQVLLVAEPTSYWHLPRVMAVKGPERRRMRAKWPQQAGPRAAEPVEEVIYPLEAADTVVGHHLVGARQSFVRFGLMFELHRSERHVFRLRRGSNLSIEDLRGIGHRCHVQPTSELLVGGQSILSWVASCAWTVNCWSLDFSNARRHPEKVAHSWKGPAGEGRRSRP